MLTIALTGGIGSGKTAVTELFQKLAAATNKKCTVEIIDADIIARELLSGSLQDTLHNSLDNSLNNGSDKSPLEKVAQLFGRELFNSDGYLQRDRLRAVIFSDKAKKKQLEDLLHPLVYKEIIKRITEFKKDDKDKTAKIIIAAIPLFFETGNYSKKHFDRILVIDTTIELQIARSCKRDGSPVDLVKKIISSQVDRQTRLKQADDIINNSGSEAALNKSVHSLFHKYCALAVQNQP